MAGVIIQTKNSVLNGDRFIIPISLILLIIWRLIWLWLFGRKIETHKLARRVILKRLIPSSKLQIWRIMVLTSSSHIGDITIHRDLLSQWRSFVFFIDLLFYYFFSILLVWFKHAWYFLNVLQVFRYNFSFRVELGVIIGLF